MKRTYTKPLIAMESFQLDAAIAASCSSQNYIPIGYSENSCGYEELSENYWNYFNLTNCEMDLTGGNNKYGDDNDELCYHGPIGQTFINS